MRRFNVYYGLLAAGAMSAVALPILTMTVGRWPPFVLLVAFLPLCFFIAGVLAFSKRPHHRAAQRLLAVGALHLLAFALAALTAILPGWLPAHWLPNLVSTICFNLGFAALLALYAVFPDGRYGRRYERFVVRAFTLAALVFPVLDLISRPTQEIILRAEGLAAPVPVTSSPLVIPALAALANLSPVVFLAPVVGLVLLVLRYRRAPAEQRMQMRWPLTSAVLLGVALLTTGIVTDVLGEMAQALIFMLVATSLPVTLVIGMLRHRLFDIDLIIRKSLIYALLWLMITLVYGVVTAALGIAAGQRLPVGLAVIITIVAAMLFQPARQRLERLADRLVFGAQLSGYDLIQQFGAILEQAFALEDLAPKVATTVRCGLHARWVRVSLHYAQHGTSVDRPIGADGITLHEPADAALVMPLVHAGEQVGLVECGPKQEGEYTDTDQRLLATLARQAALAIRNARLTAELADRLEALAAHAQELAASRVRIVQAAEAERRRIERDIHDGVQQEIVALLAKIALLRSQVDRNPARLDRTLCELQDAVRQIHVGLRELARGIHPTVLSDRGLEEAVEARIARLPIGVVIEVDPTIRGRRFAQEIEGAAYFLIAEALTNVMKHAETDEVTVRLGASTNRLQVEIVDRGRGFDPCRVKPSGLSGLKDRMEALGGTLEVVAQLGTGTRLIGTLPMREREHV